MKSNVPWSIKGIDPDARVVAKKAARAAGMTLGEWINQQIMEIGDAPQSTDGGSVQAGEAGVQPLPSNVVTVDQLREVVYSLNRLNERLKSTERDSLQAFSGINQGLTSVLERMRRVEDERQTGTDPEILDRLEAIEKDDGPRKYIDSFVALEDALTNMVGQLETTRDETLSRVSATEDAIGKLDGRIAHIDAQGAAALTQMHNRVDQVSEQLRKTEATSRALMMEARAASQSDDHEFIERTSNKLRILGTEIKRSGDQIQSLESNINKLSEKIEGAEQRSAEGITSLSGKIQALSTELTEYDKEQADVTRNAHEVITATTKTAQNRMTALQGSFEKMINRLEGVVDGEQAYREMSPAQPGPAVTAPEQPIDPSPLQHAMREAEKDMPGEADFDDVFGDALAPQPPASATQALVQDDGTSDPFFEGQEAYDAPDEATVDETLAPLTDGAETKRPPLTAKQKVILAARARRKRLEREAKKQPEAKAPDDDTQPGTAPADDQTTTDTSRIAKLREKYRKRGGGGKPPMTLILGGALVAVIIAVGFMLSNNQSGTTSAVEDNVNLGAEGSTPVSTEPEMTAAEQFSRWKTLSPTAFSEEEKNRALMILRRAAGRDYPPAQYALAEIYRTGSSGEANPTMARNWFQAAAEGGNVDAMHKLGSMYAQGIGGPMNESTAVSWFEQAATYGYVDSVYNLALIYDPGVDLGTGSSQEKNPDKAYYWYAIAAKLGDTEANSDAVRLGLLINAENRASLDAQAESWQPRPLIPSAN